MPDADTLPNAAPTDVEAAAAPIRKRPKPGERRVQILQALASMLEQPGAERVTTAALAARLDVSEAALYRHFASKAQMFEGLIEFIEQTVFTLVNQIGERESDAGNPGAGARQAAKVITMLIQSHLYAQVGIDKAVLQSWAYGLPEPEPSQAITPVAPAPVDVAPQVEPQPPAPLSPEPGSPDETPL